MLRRFSHLATGALGEGRRGVYNLTAELQWKSPAPFSTRLEINASETGQFHSKVFLHVQLWHSTTQCACYGFFSTSNPARKSRRFHHGAAWPYLAVHADFHTHGAPRHTRERYVSQRSRRFNLHPRLSFVQSWPSVLVRPLQSHASHFVVLNGLNTSEHAPRHRQQESHKFLIILVWLLFVALSSKGLNNLQNSKTIVFCQWRLGCPRPARPT